MGNENGECGISYPQLWLAGTNARTAAAPLVLLALAKAIPPFSHASPWPPVTLVQVVLRVTDDTVNDKIVSSWDTVYRDRDGVLVLHIVLE